jgi:hypothetical protein
MTILDSRFRGNDGLDDVKYMANWFYRWARNVVRRGEVCLPKANHN